MTGSGWTATIERELYMLDLDYIAETILQICQALQTVAETANHPDARAAAQTATRR